MEGFAQTDSEDELQGLLNRETGEVAKQRKALRMGSAFVVICLLVSLLLLLGGKAKDTDDQDVSGALKTRLANSVFLIAIGQDGGKADEGDSDDGSSDESDDDLCAFSSHDVDEMLTLAYFVKQNGLNRAYTKNTSYSIANRSTYWSSDRKLFVYFCKQQDRWMVVYTAHYKSAIGEADCPFTGRGPVGQGLDPGNQTGSWGEWDHETNSVFLPKYNKAGVQQVNSAAHILAKFDGGPTGLVVRMSNLSRFGKVAGVRAKSAAEKLGIQLGWRICTVNGTKFSLKAYEAAVHSSRPFTMMITQTFNAFEYDKSIGGHCGSRYHSSKDQGTLCNNCWATATTEATQWRACKAIGTNWTGEAAYLSAGYLTMCATDAFLGKHGCSTAGGDPLSAFRWIGMNGLPTGGNGDDNDSCVPSFFNGQLLENFKKKLIEKVHGEEVLVPPSCPSKCTSSKYPRSLREDLFWPMGFNESWQTAAHQSAMQAIRDDGPVIMIFPVYSDFHDYTGGVYRRSPKASFEFNHVVLAIGYGPGYISAVNSWGVDWGDHGHFNIDWNDVSSYVIPGMVAGMRRDHHGTDVQEYFIPYFPTFKHVYLVGFSDEFYNDVYTELPSKTVNGKPTYWNEMSSVFIYYCAFKNAYALTEEANFAKLAKDGAHCYWSALQRASMCQGNLTQSVRTCQWDQWDDDVDALVSCAGCGVDSVSRLKQ